MVHRRKRYTVARSGDGYEVQDGDEAGARVYFSDSHKSAREMARNLNRAHHLAEKPPPDPWAGGTHTGSAT